MTKKETTKKHKKEKSKKKPKQKKRKHSVENDTRDEEVLVADNKNSDGNDSLNEKKPSLLQNSDNNDTIKKKKKNKKKKKKQEKVLTSKALSKSNTKKESSCHSLDETMAVQEKSDKDTKTKDRKRSKRKRKREQNTKDYSVVIHEENKPTPKKKKKINDETTLLTKEDTSRNGISNNTIDKKDMGTTSTSTSTSLEKLDNYKRGYKERRELRQTINITNSDVDTVIHSLLLSTSKSFKNKKKMKRSIYKCLDSCYEEKNHITSNSERNIISNILEQQDTTIAELVWEWFDSNLTTIKNTLHYNTNLIICERTKDIKTAMKVFQLMETKDEWTYASIITLSSPFKMTMKLYTEMRVVVQNMSHATKQTYCVAYNAAISSCAKEVNCDKAFEIFQHLEQDGVQRSKISYSALISVYEKCGKWEEALIVLHQMKLAGFGVCVTAYTSVISALSRGRKWEKALEFFREIENSDETPTIVTYNATLTALERGMQWEKALNLFDEMKYNKLPVSVVSYGSAISACGKGFQWQQCLDFLDEMEERKIKKNVIIYGAAIAVMEKSYQAGLALKLLNKCVEDEGINPNVFIYNSVILACARCNMKETAQKLFHKMSDLGLAPDIVTYNAVLDAVSLDMSLARDIFKEGLRKGFYSTASELGDKFYKLDLHFLSLGSGQAAVGWWLEECLVPYLSNKSKFENVKYIAIVTGRRNSRIRNRCGEDGMSSRVRELLRHMNIEVVEQTNTGRIQIDKECFMAEVRRNGGNLAFNKEGYYNFIKQEEDAVNSAFNVVQVRRKSKGAPRKEDFFGKLQLTGNMAIQDDIANIGGRVVSNSVEKIQRKEGITLLLFYQYIEPVLSDRLYQRLVSHVQTYGDKFSITGRMRVSNEGLNCTLTGSYTNIRKWCKSLREFSSYFSDTEFKLTDNLPLRQAFPKLHAFKVTEIVNYGLSGKRAPSITKTGEHLEPKDYHTKIAEQDTVIIDVRNHYEAAIGSFEPPKEGGKYIDPMIRKSTEFPMWLDRPDTKEKLRGKQVLMYCTGGVRCERASALLRTKIETEEDTKALGIKGVYQLQGGIDKYFREFPDGGFFKGKNYVFDKRFAHAPPTIELMKDKSQIPLGKCEACHKPWDKYHSKRRCPTCGVPSLLCKDCHIADLNGTRKLDNSVKCDLCTQEGISSKRQIKEKERKEMEDYERKLRKNYNFHVCPKRLSSLSKAVAVSSSDRIPASNPKKVTRLFIKNMCKKRMNQEKLCEIISGITHIKWLKDQETCEWYGSVFVEMATPQAAAKAVQLVNGQKIYGREIKVAFAESDPNNIWPPPDTKI